MTSAEFFNKLVSMALSAEIHNGLSIRENIVAFLTIAECELGQKLLLEFQKRYGEGFDDGHKAGLKVGLKVGYDKGYNAGFKDGHWV